MRKSHSEWGSHLMFLDVGLPPVSPWLFLTWTLYSVYAVNFGFESQLHFPWCYIIPTQRKASKFIIPFWNVSYIPSCAVRRRECDSGLRVQEFYWNSILNTHTVARPQGWVLQAGGRPCSENPVWSPVQWWSKEIFFELRSKRGMLGGGRQLQMRATVIRFILIFQL